MGVAAVSWWGPSWRQNTTDTQVGCRAAADGLSCSLWALGAGPSHRWIQQLCHTEPGTRHPYPTLATPPTSHPHAQGVSTDALLPVLLEAAEAEGMAVSLHLEPYPGRTAATVRDDLLYLMRRVGGSPALLRAAKRGSELAPVSSGRPGSTAPRLATTAASSGAGAAEGAQHRGLPVFFVYDSYHIPPGDWAKLLQPGGELSLRGTEADGAGRVWVVKTEGPGSSIDTRGGTQRFGLLPVDACPCHAELDGDSPYQCCMARAGRVP